MLGAVALVVAMQGSSVTTDANAAIASSAWHEAVYNGPAKRYRRYAHCVVYTARQFKLSEGLLLSVMLQEGGTVGKRSLNANGTYDYSITQINDVRLPELREFGISKDMIMSNGCVSIFATGLLLHESLQSTAPDFWRGVGNYHYRRTGRNPSHHYRYIMAIYNRWKNLVDLGSAVANNAPYKQSRGIQ